MILIVNAFSSGWTQSMFLGGIGQHMERWGLELDVMLRFSFANIAWHVTGVCFQKPLSSKIHKL